MELGQRLRQARLESGLSQRQLCGGEITRNMLSLIENGAAKPSMDTLRYLAGRLGKPLSFFLEDEAVTSPNQQSMEQARGAYAAGDYGAAARALEGYRGPDPVFDQERGLLLCLSLMKLAEQAIREERKPYAAGLLEQAAKEQSMYWTEALERQRLLLLAQAAPERLLDAEAALPVDDRELLLRAKAALDREEAARAAQFLDAVLDQDGPDRCFLRGEAYLAQGEYAQAAQCYGKAEKAYPRQTAPRLERCFRELGDYKLAYYYARKQMDDEH